MQRVRVALTGLAAVFVLIALASAVFNWTRDEPQIAAVGVSKRDVVANMTDTPLVNSVANEPLADLGVAPTTNTASIPK